MDCTVIRRCLEPIIFDRGEHIGTIASVYLFSGIALWHLSPSTCIRLESLFISFRIVRAPPPIAQLEFSSVRPPRRRGATSRPPADKSAHPAARKCPSRPQRKDRRGRHGTRRCPSPPPMTSARYAHRDAWPAPDPQRETARTRTNGGGSDGRTAVFQRLRAARA